MRTTTPDLRAQSVDGSEPLLPPFPESTQVLINAKKTQSQNRSRSRRRKGKRDQDEDDDEDSDEDENGQQSQAAAEVSPELDILRDLPPVHIAHQYWTYSTLDPSTRIPEFLAADFSVTRLEAVYDLLWWAGRQVPARPLHRHKFLGRAIAIAEQADLHLVWSPEKTFIKPLPSYLLSHAFWSTHICPNADLHPVLTGFLLSYIWLVRYPSDFRIAKDEGLLPRGLTWEAWKAFAASFSSTIGIDRPHSVSRRYHFGELRLSRLDQLYRYIPPKFALQHVVYGYLYSYSSYGGFFKRKFAWLIVAFAYISIILSAMQVGLATPRLVEDEDFTRASYGFAVTAIMLPVIVTVVAMVLYVSLFLFHLIVTLSAYFGERHRFKQARGGG